MVRFQRSGGVLRLDTRQPNQFSLLRDNRSAQWIILTITAAAVANAALFLYLAGQTWLAIAAALVAACAATALVVLSVQHRPFAAAVLWLSRNPFRGDTLSVSIELTLRHPPSTATVDIVWMRVGSRIAVKELTSPVMLRAKTPLIRFPLDGDSTADELQLTVRRGEHRLARFTLKNERTA